MFNSFNFAPTGDEDSISKYGNFGPAGMMQNNALSNDTQSSTGFNFADILKAQMPAPQTISSELDTILLRLENQQPLINIDPEHAAKEMFKAINMILSGTHDLLNQISKGPSLNPHAINLNPAATHSEELHRLFEGAKALFDTHQDPFILEELGEIWKNLKTAKSPLFDSIHSYFFSIAIGLSGNGEATLQDDQLEQTFIDIIASLPPCDDKTDLELAITQANDNQSELELDSTDYLSESEQLNFFN